MEIGIAYAIWSAVGMTIITIIGVLFFQESLSALKFISLLLVIIGVVGLNLRGLKN